MYRYCAEHRIAHERCGKLVVATDPSEIPRLDELERRGEANGLRGVRRLRAEQLADYEPHVVGVAGLLVPDTGIVDFGAVARSIGRQLQEAGSEVITGVRVQAVERRESSFILRSQTREITARNLVACAGLQADRVARMCGLSSGVRIVPFRGEYYKLRPESEGLVRNLIYPVPDPRFPFLGVHFTRMAVGGVEAGPNAVLSFKRGGYQRAGFSLRDSLDTFRHPGFWLLARQYWKTAIGEWHRSLSRRAFVGALRKLIPEIRAEEIVPHGGGVRAQAVTFDGRLLDDFEIAEGDGMLHVLNAPSPAATASLAIGDTLATRAAALFSLRLR
jgi:L-2-hydroxyglutarate oxidase